MIVIENRMFATVKVEGAVSLTMNTYVLVYNSFVQFEVVLAAYFMKTQSEVHTLGLNSMPVISCEGFSINPSAVLGNMDVNAIDLLVIPGGEVGELAANESLLALIRSMNAAGKTVAGICGGVTVLKAAGVLEGRSYVDNQEGREAAENAKGLPDAGTSDEVNVIRDGNILTAKPNGYVDFALELGRMMDIYQDEADLQETIDFFKYFKSV